MPEETAAAAETVETWINESPLDWWAVRWRKLAADWISEVGITPETLVESWPSSETLPQLFLEGGRLPGLHTLVPEQALGNSPSVVPRRVERPPRSGGAPQGYGRILQDIQSGALVRPLG